MTQAKPLHLPSTAETLPEGWAWWRLDDACEGVYDCPHSTPAITDSGPLMARSQDIRSGVFRTHEAAHVSEETHRERTQRAEPRYGDLLYSREGTYFGIAAEVPERVRVCLGQRMVLLRPKPDVLNFRFLRYWLNSPVIALHVHGHRDGTVAERLNLPTIRGLPIAVPPMREQDVIADALGALDDQIELNRRMNETLEAMARALFMSWFVDFDPVRARAEGRQPAGMDAQTASLFPGAFVDSALGKVPKGWSVKALPEAIEVNPPRLLAKGAVAPYLEMGNMPTSSARALSWEMREAGSGMRFVNGDVLLARITPCLENGKTAFVDFLMDGQVGWGSTEYIVFRSKPPLPAVHAYFLARTDDLRTHAIKNMTGTSGRQRVPAECFNSYLVVVPPEPVAKRFGEWATGVMQTMLAHDKQSETLAAIRDALLPKLLSGELRVKEAERLVERRT
jgi:type I restriction enzyme, S subunit